MQNPYFELHREFRKAGADVLISSGQACVAFGIATFSKDGDWIIRENERSCQAVLSVLGARDASYRLGAPLHPDWLCRGLTSHFELRSPDGLRLRTDFCSRPPRVPDVEHLWACAVRADEMDVVDVESLMKLKQTRRIRDYSMIGALAELSGLEEDAPELALRYLQDYEHLARAVRRWPDQAASCEREAVRLLREKAPRAAVVSAIAIEQDLRMQEDDVRVQDLEARYSGLAREFARARVAWRRARTPLAEQHRQLLVLARSVRERSP